MDSELALQLTQTFARAERALKSHGFLKRQVTSWAPHPLAFADWVAFGKAIGPRLTIDSRILQILCEPGPMIELVIERKCTFVSVHFPGDTDGERAINAARQVRNNLFHGSKLLEEGAVSDDEFMGAAIQVLSDSLSLI